MPQYSYQRLKPGYTSLWAQMHVTKGLAAGRQARQIQANKARYQTVEARTGVPWFVIGVLHMRESGASFTTWLHNGDPMRNRQGKPIRTRQVPAGRPRNPDCTWEDGAVDAIVYQHLDGQTDWCPEFAAYAFEKFNGWGYRGPSINIPSPYLWGGTSVQKPGKFIRDHVFSHTVMDPQIGAMAVLRAIIDNDPDATFAPVAVAVPLLEDEEPVEQNMSPKAIDGEAQVSTSAMGLFRSSSTIKATLLGWCTSMTGWGTALLDKLHDPVYLTLFIVGVAVACYATWLAVTGRINVQKLVAHLADDNTV